MMNKKFLTFGILVIVLAGIFVPSFAFAQTTPNVGKAILASTGPVGSLAALFTPNNFSLWESGAKFIGQTLMTISSLVLVISGKIFDTVVEFSILNMAKNLSDSVGIGGGITAAWATLRDIANMCFIFVLLYAAFKTMFDSNFSNFQTTIKNIIIVALLINFSLFFSKVVIDASNIVSVGFYNSIATSNNADLSGSKNTGITGVETFKGVSGGYMRMLGIQTFFSANILDAQPGGKKLDAVQILILGIMSSVFMLVTAVVLLIAGIMFAARFIILIFLMILSPLALIAFIIPGQMGKFNEWKDALIAQSFFAPLYFALTWVVFKLGTSLITILKTPQAGQTTDWTSIVTAPSSAMALLLNYVLIIGFSIAALIFSKQMASKTTGFKAISGGIGTVAMGGVGLVGRNTIGRGSRAIAESSWVKNKASGTGVGAGFARAGLWTANKGGKASFDTRGLAETKLGKATGASDVMGIAGKTSGKGGFRASVDAKAKTQYAKDVYGQTGQEKDQVAEKKKDYEDHLDENGNPVKGSKTLSEEATKEHEKKIKEEEDVAKKAEKEEATKEKTAEEDLETKKEEAKKANYSADPVARAAAKKAVEEAEANLGTVKNSHQEAINKMRLVVENKQYSDAVTALAKEAGTAKETADRDKKILDQATDAGKKRQAAYAERLGGGLFGTKWLGRFQPNQGYKEAAREVRKQAKEKTTDKKIADLLREDAKNTGATTASITPTPVPSTSPATPTTPTPNP